jgi:hypothetical protein
MTTKVPSLSVRDSPVIHHRLSTSNTDPDCSLCDGELDRDERDESLPDSAEMPGLTLESASALLYDSIEEYQTRLLVLEPGPFGSQLKAQSHTGYIVHQSGIVIHEWKQRVQYAALSYTWGSQEFPNSILINDVAMPITSNLFAFLQRYRDNTESRNLWIDALCINQSNLTEKAMQVKNMMKIYERAELVVVWLGDQGKRTNFAMRALESTKVLDSSREDARTPLCLMCLDALIDGIEDIGNRNWARRIWIKQEVYAAKQLIVWCGGRQLD